MSLALSQARWELGQLLRNGEQLLLTFLIPLGVLVFTRDLVPVVTTSTLAAMFTSLAIATGFERRSGALRFLGVTPLSRSQLLAAKLLASATVLLLSLAVSFAVAAVLHCLPAWSAAGWGAGLLSVLLGCTAGASWGLLLAGTVRAEAVLAIANAVFLVLLAAALALPGHLSAPWSSIVLVLPSVALAQGLRSPSMSSIVILAAWSVLGIALARSRFRWDD